MDQIREQVILRASVYSLSLYVTACEVYQFEDERPVLFGEPEKVHRQGQGHGTSALVVFLQYVGFFTRVTRCILRCYNIVASGYGNDGVT